MLFGSNFFFSISFTKVNKFEANYSIEERESERDRFFLRFDSFNVNPIDGLSVSKMMMSTTINDDDVNDEDNFWIISRLFQNFFLDQKLYCYRYWIDYVLIKIIEPNEKKFQSKFYSISFVKWIASYFFYSHLLDNINYHHPHHNY